MPEHLSPRWLMYQQGSPNHFKAILYLNTSFPALSIAQNTFLVFHFFLQVMADFLWQAAFWSVVGNSLEWLKHFQITDKIHWEGSWFILYPY